MKIVRWAAVVAFLMITANIALADGVGDPRFQTIGGGGSTILTSLNDSNFQVNYIASGVNATPTVACGQFGGTSDDTCILDYFINNTHQAWTGISFVITGVGGSVTENSFSADNTADPYFTTASLAFNDAGQAILSFFGTDATHPGILPADPGSCTDGPNSCTGSYIFPDDSEFGIPTWDFGILVDVSGARGPNDSFTAQGSAAVPEPKSIVLMLAGAALVGLFLSKRAA